MDYHTRTPTASHRDDDGGAAMARFASASDAVAYALAYHHAIGALDRPLEARAGLHVGPVILTENTPADVARGAKPVEVDGLAKPTWVGSANAGGEGRLFRDRLPADHHGCPPWRRREPAALTQRERFV